MITTTTILILIAVLGLANLIMAFSIGNFLARMATTTGEMREQIDNIHIKIYGGSESLVPPDSGLVDVKSTR